MPPPGNEPLPCLLGAGGTGTAVLPGKPGMAEGAREGIDWQVMKEQKRGSGEPLFCSRVDDSAYADQSGMAVSSRRCGNFLVQRYNTHHLITSVLPLVKYLSV